MQYIHFTNKGYLGSILKKGILPKENDHGFGILCYPLMKVPFRSPVVEDESLDEFLAAADRWNNTLSIEQSWELVGASGLRQHKKTVVGVIFEMDLHHWPLKIHIDIRHFLAEKFAYNLHKHQNEGITYGTSGSSLLEVIQRIKSKRYVLEGKFKVDTEKNLLELIKMFKNAGGGLYGAHSFDCMISKPIKKESFKRFIEF